MKHSNIQNICLTGLFSAIIVIMSQIAIPMPLCVPMTMQTFAVTLAGIILGSKFGALSTFIYMLLGAIGLPVFANFTGGWQSFVGPTGGFILSFPLMAFLIGLGVENRSKWKYSLLIGIILGTTVNLLCGLLMFCFLTNSSLLVGFTTCILPFLPATIIKAILASIIGTQIKRHLNLFFYT